LQQYGTRPRTLEEIEMSQPFSDRIVTPIIRGMSRLISRFTPQRNVEATRLKLELAGNPNNWTVSDFLGVRGPAALLTGGLFALLFTVLRADPALILLFVGAGGAFGFYLPLFWLNSKIRSRQKEIQKALPDALDLLTISVEAGLAFDSAMAKVTEKWDNELSRAFGRVIAEVRVGKLRREKARDEGNHPVLAALREVAQETGVWLLIGSLAVDLSREPGTAEGQHRLANRSYLVDPSGAVVARYDKIHLVPFGEFLPFKSAVPPLYRLFLKMSPYPEEYTLTAGPPDAMTVFTLGRGWRFVTPICFEDIDAALVHRMFAPAGNGKRADFIVPGAAG